MKQKIASRAQRFVNESGAARDQRKVSARLNIKYLEKVARATGVPLVLHGGRASNPITSARRRELASR